MDMLSEMAELVVLGGAFDALNDVPESLSWMKFAVMPSRCHPSLPWLANRCWM